MSAILRVRQDANGVGIEGRFFYSAEWVCQIRALDERRMIGWFAVGAVIVAIVFVALGFQLGAESNAAMLRGGV